MTLSPGATASKQKMQNIVMAIVEFSVDNTVCEPPRRKISKKVTQFGEIRMSLS